MPTPTPTQLAASGPPCTRVRSGSTPDVGSRISARPFSDALPAELRLRSAHVIDGSISRLVFAREVPVRLRTWAPLPPPEETIHAKSQLVRLQPPTPRDARRRASRTWASLGRHFRSLNEGITHSVCSLGGRPTPMQLDWPSTRLVHGRIRFDSGHGLSRPADKAPHAKERNVGSNPTEGSAVERRPERRPRSLADKALDF